MEDSKIIELYFDRSESAIIETQNKYGRYCFFIAYHILYSNQDSEECVNDTYLSVWNTIPPQKPLQLRAFVGKITRNIALNRYDYNNAEKRSPKYEAILDEYYECTLGGDLDIMEEYSFKELINKFIASLPKKNRIIFLQRYWYFCSINEIARNLGLSESNVKVILHRIKAKLKDYLNKEGINI
ncbi:MAG: sigma-70 family RNA polymerase sigma factor [Clostridiales bacterium]|nr:sigma-70 family RNA polymerase sigma factor [Clostridiales bacterium]